MRKVLKQSFFERPALEVSQDLIGMYLLRNIKGRELALMITEVEAYDGPEDKACHARFGKTERNAVMFGPAGHWYIYLCYGMYWMLNIVVDREDYPAAILIRGGLEVSGPGRLTKHMGLDKQINQKIANPDSGLWFEDRGEIVAHELIKRTPRIGIDYAEDWVNKPYRFILES